MENYIVALDVGGTFTKASVARLREDKGFDFIEDKCSYYPSRALEDKETILQNFKDIIDKQINKIEDSTCMILGVGLGFPGPFHYESGVSYIKGVDKFEAIYGVNIREELTNHLTQQSGDQYTISRDFHVMFDNDVNLFGLGECAIGKAKVYEKTICLSIGTGFNSAFTLDGKVIKNHEGIPKDGWIYNCAFRDGVIDDYASKRGILRIVRENEWNDLDLEIKDIALKAFDGDKRAQKVFREFGETVGEAIRPYVDRYDPDAIIFGGQISKSFALFKEGIRYALQRDIIMETSDDSVISTLAGAVKLIIDS